MIGMILAAFTLGMVVAIPPGPVTIATGQRAITYGFWNAFTFNLGSITSDALYAAASFSMLRVILTESVPLQLALWILGGTWLCWMGITAMRTRIDLKALDEQVVQHSRWSNYRSGLLITLFNPLTIVAWVALAGNFFSQWNVDWPSRDTFGLFAVVIMLLGTMSWVVVLAIALSSLRRFIKPALVRWISIGSGLFLIVYGLSAWGSAAVLILGS